MVVYALSRQLYGFKLVRLRNPYERGEWKGDWANDSRLWEENPEVKHLAAHIPRAILMT
jgi:hypothetical protein